MEVKVTLDLSDRFIGCLDAAVEALKDLMPTKAESPMATAIDPAGLKAEPMLAIPKNILERINSGEEVFKLSETTEFVQKNNETEEPAKEPAPARRRASKKAAKEVEHEVAEGAAPAEPVGESEEQPAEGMKKDISLVDIRPYLKALWETGHNDSNDKTFAHYGATGLKDLDPTKYEEFFEDLQELVKNFGIEDKVNAYVSKGN